MHASWRAAPVADPALRWQPRDSEEAQRRILRRLHMATAVRRGLPILIAGFLIASISALVVTSTRPTTYEATAIVGIGSSTRPGTQDRTGLLISARLAPTYARLVKSRSVLSGVAERLDRSVEGIAQNVEASVDGEARLVISAQADEAFAAAELANAVALEIVSTPGLLGPVENDDGFIQDEIASTVARIVSIAPEIEAIGVELDTLAPQNVAQLTAYLELAQERLDLQEAIAAQFARYRTLRRTAARDTAGIPAIIESASAPGGPISPRPVLNVILAGLLGVVLVLPLAAPALTASTIRSAADVRHLTGLEVLRNITPQTQRRARGRRHHLSRFIALDLPAPDDYGALRWGLGLAEWEERARNLLVIGADRNEGRTVVAANLAVHLAQSGRRILLVDADPSAPELHEIFGVAASPGLIDVLAHSGPPLDSVIRRTEVRGLDVLPSGGSPMTPLATLDASSLPSTLLELSSDYDLVISAGPSPSASSDAEVQAAFAGATLVVFDAGVTTRRAANDVNRLISVPGVTATGAVLMRLPRKTYRGHDSASRRPRPRPAGRPAAAEGTR